ncbi:MAG: hypothetical protein Q9227_000251 [Pyrenula ochraceoflavens]
MSAQRTVKSAVPKFSSFKPKNAGNHDDRQGSAAKEEISSRPPGEQHGTTTPVKRHERDKKHTHRHRSRSLRQSSREPTTKDVASSSLQPSKRDRFKQGLSDEEISQYMIDNSGDPENTRYGTSNRYEIPLYRLSGYGNAIGAQRHEISRPSKTGKPLLARTDTGPQEIYQVIRSIDDPKFNAHTDYIDLDVDGRKRRKLGVAHDDPEHGRSDDEDHYRSLLGARTPKVSDKQLQQVRDDDDQKLADKDLESRRHTATLSKRIEENPKDADAWLALIEYQDVLKMRAASNSEIKSLAEIKLSIYEKALSQISDPNRRATLVIGMLEEGSKLWDSKKLDAQWQRAVKAEDTNVGLWIQYLNFQQTNSLCFSFEQCRTTYQQIFERIVQQSPSQQDDQTCSYVFLRWTSFLLDTGYAELATALWQAELEFTFFKPDNSLGSVDLDGFEAFWDREVPRIGERGGKGWKSMLEAQEADPKADDSTDQVDSLVGATFASWTKCESNRARNARMPARTLDDVEEDDAYRVILFSDVKAWLFRPRTVEGTAFLINAFINFCGLPAAGLAGLSRISTWWSDPFLVKGPELADIRLRTPHQSVMVSFPHTDLLFPAESDSIINQWTSTQLNDEGSIPLNFKLETLKLLVDNILYQELFWEYLIALLLQIDRREARRYSKGLLKKRPNSLRLYNAHALVECRIGDLAAAERVWSTALSMSKEFSVPDKRVAILLWRSWIWELLRDRNFTKALNLLLLIPEEQPKLDSNPTNSVSSTPSSSQILKARQYLRSMVEHAITFGEDHILSYHSDSLALLEYLLASRSLSAAISVYSETISRLPSTSNAQELLYQCQARLLHFHVETSPTHQPSYVTSVMLTSLTAFPNNTMFGDLFAHHTRHSFLTDRLRILPTLESVLSTAKTIENAGSDRPSSSIVPALLVVATAAQRPNSLGANKHTIRTAFERAVSLMPTSPLLWRAFLHYETCGSALSSTPFDSNDGVESETRQADKKMLKDLFYRALRSVPWICKELMMMACGNSILESCFSWKEKKTLWEVLGEKGVRVRVDISELLEDQKIAGDSD